MLWPWRSGTVLVPKGINGLDYTADLDFDKVSLEEFLARRPATAAR